MRTKSLAFLILLTLILSFTIPSSANTIMAADYEHAWFPVSVLRITQLAYESASHGNSMHIDCNGADYAFAPFTGRIVDVQSSFGVCLFQSENPVYYPDGTLGYMTVQFMHGSNYSYLKSLRDNGTLIKQGTNFYKIGDVGSPGAFHYDIGVYKGQKSRITAPYSQFGNTFPFDAFYINTNKTSIVNKGKVKPGNWVNKGAPTDYSNLWVNLGSTNPNPNPGHISVTYQIYDDVYRRWLPDVTDTQDFAGIFGHDVDCVYANLSSGNITYKVHVKGGSWLPAVVNRSDYAGIKGKPIDGLMIKTDTGRTVHYRVHLRRSNRWLPWVTGYNQYDSNNGYAGILGQEIDAIEIYLD